MQSAPKPDTEKSRLQTLYKYKILDTLSEIEYDRITKLASTICGTPIALVSLVDANRQWFKSKVGIEASETPRDISFCAHAILAPNDVLIVNDTLNDKRFHDNPAVIGEPKIRFYAGVPLQVSSGDTLGTLCVADTVPKQLTAEQISALRQLAKNITMLLERRLKSNRLFTHSGTIAILMVTLFVGVTTTIFYEHQKISNTAKSWVRHSYEINYCLQNLLSDIHDTEMAVHRYKLTKQQRYFEVYSNNIKPRHAYELLFTVPQTKIESGLPSNIPEAFKVRDHLSLGEEINIILWLTSDNPRQIQRITELNEKFNALKAFWIKTLSEKNAKNETDLAKDNFIERQAILDDVQDIIKNTANEEDRLLSQRINTDNHDSTTKHIFELFGVLLFYSFALLGIYLYQKNRKRADTEIAEYVLKLENASKSLSESNQLNEAIISGANHMIVASDLKGNITLFNKQAERLLGYEANEIIAKQTAVLWHDRDEVIARAGELSKELGRNIEPGLEVFTAKPKLEGSESTEWTFINKQGKRFPGNLVVTPIRASDNSITGYVGIIEDITNRKVVEKERSKLLSIIDRAPDYIGVSDLEGNLQYHNRAAKILSGLPENQDMTGLKISHMHPDWAIKLVEKEAIPTVLDKGVWWGETAILHRDGHEIPVSQMLTMYRDENGNPEGFATIMRDITERKKIEEEIRLSEERHRMLVDGVADYAIYWLDVDGYINSWNAGACNLKGYKDYEVIGKHFSIFFTPEDLKSELPRRALEIASEQGKYEAEGWRVRKDGKRFWAHVLLEPIRDSRGMIVGFAKISHDETERQHIQNTLKQAADGLQLGWQGTGVGMWDWNVTTNELIWSDRFNALLGFEPSELPANYVAWEERLHNEDKENTLNVLNSYLSREIDNYDVDYRLKTKSGEWRWYHATGKAIWDEDSKPLRMVGSLDDITPRKTAEESREKLLGQIMQSNTNLERFAYVASHDMQEPLRMIANFSGLIAEEYSDKLDETGKEYIDLVKHSAERMQTMVEDLLNYARVKNDESRFVDVDSELELKHVLENLSSAIKERNAIITHDPLPAFTGNPVQFMRLLQNLIGNGLKYQTTHNIPEIHIGVIDKPYHWRFSVKDNGIGINEEFVNQVFEPFKRLHTWDDYKGSGIGLAVCKQIVESHGGQIWATSKFGKGSTFHFTIAKDNGEHDKKSEAA